MSQSSVEESQKHQKKTLPVWSLTPAEEKELDLRWKEQSSYLCLKFNDDLIKCFNENRALGPFVCRSVQKTLRGCLNQYRTYEFYDKIRDEMIQEKIDTLLNSED
ncbi:Cmc1p ASCRUDRAFT_11007 [Ascoidea rubescens DSM 1968]|uniref:COX assembly mitochondrial protein n=1 Tax=Ascoidea rubescens DSM 1968 TaxID=1344418 RepID=A0A1D2VPJ2_9ASCO|nr:hypothetical protein ASCRUDRAFT_11007 [Ascoidea rubescens DSM 1968]ODV63530.1 hypothetical protein ASCRUDRAFT_11007 [Ascoidea rubescens DSM 1968]